VPQDKGCGSVSADQPKRGSAEERERTCGDLRGSIASSSPSAAAPASAVLAEKRAQNSPKYLMLPEWKIKNL
jgi:hypothetical protein